LGGQFGVERVATLRGIRRLSLAAHFEQWEPGASYIIAGKLATGAGSMALTLAENFATSGGHLIWIGITDDLHRMYEQLMFKNAGLVLAAAGSTVPLDAVAQFKLKYAHEQIGKMWIDFCNVEECGNADAEQEFLASVASFKPTLIVVDESIFDETTLDPFEILVRQTHALHMVKELRRTNPMSSVLWHLPMLLDDGDVVAKQQRPTLDDLASAASSIKPDVVMLVHVCHESKSQHNAEVNVAANAFGSTGIVPMAFDSIHCTWHDLANSARAD
ncbi:MAG: hypothetical protein V4633_23605, partial [Pseudomonadota bacterium]